MPLIWKDSDHFKNKGDYRRFAVFCLLKIGTEIYDTIMVTNVDRSVTDIQFDDICVFANIPPDFEFKLEVYSRVLHDDLSIASTPRKLSKKISTSVSRTLGRKLAAAVKEDMDSENGPKFHLVATATLGLKHASDAIKTHDLVVENLENRNSQLPLFGHFCCRLAVQPDCQTIERIAGYLKVKEATVRTQKIESVYWASLKNFQLRFWSKKYDRNSSSSYGSSKKRFDTIDADLVVPINKKTKVNCGSNALTINTDDKCYILSNDNTLSDIKLWAKQLEQTIQDFNTWESVAEYHMPIPSPSPTRAPMYLKQRIPGSLYDETPIQAEPQTQNYGKSNGTLPRRISNGDSLRSRSSSLSSSCTNSSTTTSNGKHSQQSSPTQYNDPQMDCKHNFLFFRPTNAGKALMNY
ncbi:unnamed protein product [Medioppia subpectinata]|uniref:Anillin homology domain-containing protein n=1 Tax=Medioppia subpectinata TaxID=1979941 RepID=A0A7R9KIU6_9ACAR|nr:unnamed protein product [Medioppia subpectinata]CAG2104498.1 unnamed protein product [Medioppia subpectinata]